MKYEPCKKVYVCCGQYIAPTDSVKDKKLYCTRCGQELKTPVTVPKIIIVKNS